MIGEIGENEPKNERIAISGRGAGVTAERFVKSKPPSRVLRAELSYIKPKRETMRGRFSLIEMVRLLLNKSKKKPSLFTNYSEV